MKEINYNREKVLEYAKRWAYDRNPKYYNFDSVGGDCTNFASQCIYEGCKVMNYTKEKGWYYVNGNNKAPAWSGVEFLYNFLINNKSVGPYGTNSNQSEIEIGDIVQLSFDGQKFAHTLVVVKIENRLSLNGIYVASHTLDSFGKSISSYTFAKIRFIHIQGARKY